jgi:3-dehydroquinate synthase
MKIDVELPGRMYSVRIGPHLFRDDFARIEGVFRGRSRLFVVTDENVLAVCWPVVAPRLEAAGPAVERFVLRGGEGDKSLEETARCWEAMARSGCDRDSAVVALGGGVVGDFAGFVASTWMRGIDIVQVPTTLLAMVDSALGGKTAINIPGGKNMVGTFHQPAAVAVDLSFLSTLPEAVFRDGLAEVVKYAVIGGGDLPSMLRDRADGILERDPVVLGEVVGRCCRLKAEIVAADERDEGRRTVLNFGHTIGHAIEAAGGFSRYTHGAAVAIGMRGAFRISRRLGLTGEAEERRFEELLRVFRLPRSWALDGVSPADLWRIMDRDKKGRGGRLNYVLTKGFGSVIIRDAKPEKRLILKVLDDLRE